jgi:hypothetical protein
VAVLGLAAALLLGGCGGGGSGGGGDAGTVGPLSIVTDELPTAGISTVYDAAVEASGGAGDYTWRVVSGALPPGVVFSSSGSFSGTPTALGTYPLTVEVRDAVSASDEATFSLTVSTFSVRVTSLRYGEAWEGESYSVTSVGGGASVTFSFVVNASGAALVSPNPSKGTVTYVPGPTPGVDRIRGTNAFGETDDVDVRAVDHPVASMTARFGSTDVWYVRFDGKEDAGHPYACDFDAALVAVGLRSPTSVDDEGTEADELARAYVRREVLRHLNVHYGNAADGTPLGGGLDISFPFDEPPFPQRFCPDFGDVEDPDPDQYSVISVLAGFEAGVIGTAYLDADNDSQENDTTAPGTGDLGVFCNEIAVYFNASYSNHALRASPVGPGDVVALRALLHGEPDTGGRYGELRRIGVGYARTLAATAAHEIGHSLGLEHTDPASSGSIMNASAIIGPGATYSFTSGDYATLEDSLPGPGRTGLPLSLPSTATSGVRTAIVCGCCRTSAGD